MKFQYFDSSTNYEIFWKSYYLYSKQRNEHFVNISNLYINFGIQRKQNFDFVKNRYAVNVTTIFINFRKIVVKFEKPSLKSTKLDKISYQNVASMYIILKHSFRSKLCTHDKKKKENTARKDQYIPRFTQNLKQLNCNYHLFVRHKYTLYNCDKKF